MRKRTEEEKIRQRNYQREWRKNNKERARDYQRTYNKENPEKVKEKYNKYSKTSKGIVNTLKKKDRKKFGFYDTGLNEELIKDINNRDKFCVYCNIELKNIKTEYDHLNPFLPLSNINVVKCCRECNRSKSSANVLEWCKFMKYIPNNIIFELLKKQKE